MPRKLTKDEFIRRSIESHPDTQYGYDKVEFHNLRERVTIWCPDCKNYFQQEAGTHMRGASCPLCTTKRQGNKKRHPQKSKHLNTEEFIKRALEIPGNDKKYDYGDVYCKNFESKVLIFCKDCSNYFLQSARSHLLGSGCPHCISKSKSEKVKLSWLQIIDKLKIKFGENVDYSLVPTEGKWKPEQEITLRCIKHNEIKTSKALYFINNRFNCFCSRCRKDKERNYRTATDLRKQLNEKFPQYTFKDEDYKGWNRTMEFYCTIHNEYFTAAPINLFKEGSCRCPFCTLKKKPGKPMSLEDFIKKAKEVHGNKYDYSLIKEEDWNGINSYIDIRCPEHDEVFNVAARRHLNGKGKCPECWIEEHGKIYEISPEEIERRGREKHGDKYDYSLITEPHRIHDIVNIICPNHGPFETTLSDHFSWKGCPECSDRESIGEKLTKDVLDSYNISFDDEVYLEGCDYKGHLFFDVYIEKHNICIEYQGAQHYRPIERFGGEKEFQEIQARDQTKRDYCKENNIVEIEIPYIYNTFTDIELFLIPQIEKATNTKFSKIEKKELSNKSVEKSTL